jgi:putative tryptophan/tyrosine transport system substrate-binding protein
MRRREFIALVTSTAGAWARAADARQSDRIARVALGKPQTNDPLGQKDYEAFRRALAARGWIEGRNLELVGPPTDFDPAAGRANVSALIALKPDFIVLGVSTAVKQAMQETRTIPIVFIGIADPVSQGLVTNLAHPGRNATGFLAFEASLGGKWMELLKELVPGTTRVAFLYEPSTAPFAAGMIGAATAGASSLGVTVLDIPVHNIAELERAIANLASEPGGSMIIPPSIFTNLNTRLIISLASIHRVPAIYAYGTYVAAGGLISYGVDLPELYRRGAEYVDRILRGADPADLPVQSPTKFELVINLKTAKTLGLTVPPSLLARADEVIE